MNYISKLKFFIKYIRPIICISLLPFISVQTYSSVPLTLDGSIKGGNNRNYAQAGALIPIQLNEYDLTFMDLRFMHNLPHSGNKLYHSPKSYEANLGGGYRLAIDEDMVIGGAAYYDIRNAQTSKAHFSQITMNIHLLTSTWQTQGNIYVPIDKKKITKTTNKFNGKGKVINKDIFFIYDQNNSIEKSLPGLDYRISRSIPGVENVRIGSLLYHFKDKKSISGIGMDLSWAINENVRFETSYTYDKVRKNNILLGVRFTMPIGEVKQSRNIDKLMATRVERDLDIVVNRSANITQNNVRQNNMMGIGQNDLSNPNGIANIRENLQTLSKLQKIYNSGGTLILADEDKEFDYDKVNKISGDDLKTKVATEQHNAKIKLSQNEQISTIINDASQNDDSLIRQIKVFGAMKAYQDKSNSSGFYLAGKMKVDKDAELAKLFSKYARLSSTGNKIFRIDLPGYPNAIVERAGAILLVRENGQNYVVVGTDINSQNHHRADGKLPWSSWFSGSVNRADASIEETILRESYEESSGTVYISKNDFDSAIADGRFFYSPEYKILTIVHPDTDGIYITSDLTKNLSKLKSDPTITYSMKEMSEYHKVPVSEMLNLYNRMSSANDKNPYNIAYNVKADGRFLRIESHYAKAFGSTINGYESLIKAQNKLPH
jgi:hypothetical protein